MKPIIGAKDVYVRGIVSRLDRTVTFWFIFRVPKRKIELDLQPQYWVEVANHEDY